jgi:hypothetical protein
MKYETLIHERVALARTGQNPTVIGRTASGWAVLGDVQMPLGYCCPIRSCRASTA